MNTAKQLLTSIRSNQRAIASLKSLGVNVKLSTRHGSYLTEVSGGPVGTKGVLTAMGGQWLEGWQVAVFIPKEFNAGQLVAALRVIESMPPSRI